MLGLSNMHEIGGLMASGACERPGHFETFYTGRLHTPLAVPIWRATNYSELQRGNTSSSPRRPDAVRGEDSAEGCTGRNAKTVNPKNENESQLAR